MAANPTSRSYGATPDVKFVFPENGDSTMNVEKRKLMNISQVFRAQFSSDFDNNQPIKITDISIEVFNMIIDFIYNGKISITESNYQEILYASTKYFIYPIISEVIKFAVRYIGSDNVVDVYEFFEKYDIPKINEHILKVCVEYPAKVIGKFNGSNCIHMKLLKEILQSPFMHCSEYDLYVAIVSMMENAITGHVTDVAAEMRKKLGKLIYLIQFPTMTSKELARCANAPSLLTAEELKELLIWVELGIYSEVLTKFSTKPRINLTLHQCKKCKCSSSYCHGYCKN